MITDTAPATRHWGHTSYTSAQVSGFPLGYDREATPVAATIPGTPDRPLRRALERCAGVVAAFDGKLGDSLLALGAVAAITDALDVLGRNVPLTTVGRYGHLYPTGWTNGVRASPPRLIVGDEPGLALASPTRDDHVICCRPEQAHCRIDGPRAHPFLPARYYLGIEERLGLRLPGTPPFLPPLAHDSPSPEEEGLTIAAVTATSWPGRKDYGAERFTAAAQEIARGSRRRVRLLLVSGHGPTAPAPPDTAEARVQPVTGADLRTLTDLFARCDVILGNDTGLTHLAALVSAKAQVIGLYGRHSHSKWRTGLSRHHALATPFSEHMHRQDLCPVRDRTHETDNERRAPLSAISPATLADTALQALEHP
ncbi:glycosyltransferase family 9 protein [Nocardiopsis sp. CNT312]|uniref:glycosyltransferase family 9 protein n=1 Tax=Nocardiopsis sp. CNT312 TaxID=1137268 RepID=UPI0004910AA8|nr:glycosyltransferase family 9 protein [Nocardiopsis sp. CNT312]